MSGETTARPDAATRRPDASMSLLTDLMREPGTLEYVEAARRRPAGSGPPPRRPVVVAGVLLLVGLLLAAAAVQWRGQASAVAAERAGLATRIRAETARSDSLTASVTALEAEVGELRDAQLGGATLSAADRARVDALGVATGTTAATGPGVRIELSDAPEGAATDPGCESGRVLDVDLQRLVNGLWAAGAEAVSVGGQRLTGQTAIRSAADAILVGYRPIDPPYEVLALGDPRTLEPRLAAGDAGGWFQTLADLCGVGYSVSTEDSLTLAAAPAGALRAAVPVTRPAATAGAGAAAPGASASPPEESP